MNSIHRDGNFLRRRIDTKELSYGIVTWDGHRQIVLPQLRCFFHGGPLDLDSGVILRKVNVWSV
jgi:hypothetical protein